MRIALIQKLTVGLLALWCVAASGASIGAPSCGALGPAMPARDARSPAAHQFAGELLDMGEPARDLAIRRELLAGNIPGFLRALQPVSMDGVVAGLGAVHVTLCVLADYLSVGSDDDFLRVPMGLETAQRVAATFGAILPTRRMVDAIYRQAAVHLTPLPLPAGDQMRSTDYYRAHNALVQQQRDALGAPPQALTSGQKKDLVLSARLWRDPGRVAIYGWHRGVGDPIQPLSTVHGARYADYSHGVRLVSNVAYVNGVARSIFELLEDPSWAAVLSDEGPLPGAAGLFGALADAGRRD